MNLRSFLVRNPESRQLRAISVCTIYWLRAARVMLMRPICPSRGSHPSVRPSCPTAVLLHAVACTLDEGLSQIRRSDALSTSVNEKKKNPQASAMLLHVHLGRPQAGVSLLCPVLVQRAPHPFTQKYGQTGLGDSWYGYASPSKGVAVGVERSGREVGGRDESSRRLWLAETGQPAPSKDCDSIYGSESQAILSIGNANAKCPDVGA